MIRICLVLLICISSPLYALGLFEEATSGEPEEIASLAATSYELNGSLRGVFYGSQQVVDDEVSTQSRYSELTLKIRARQQDRGDVFAEIRLAEGDQFGLAVRDVTLREAYVNAYLGPFDLRVGEQVVVWGRADGFNPTDNITPKNPVVRSPDEDDRRGSNFLLRAFYNQTPFRLEAIWIPVYEPSALSTSVVPLAEELGLGTPAYPDSAVLRSSFATKLHLELPSLDGSISYFNGFSPSPGINLRIGIGNSRSFIYPTAYRMHVVGADFATTVSSFMGLRGEVAYRRPHDDANLFLHIPMSDLQYVLGIDKELGNLSVLAQYVGRHVLDFTESNPASHPSPPQVFHMMELRNRMLNGQQHEWTHALSFRPAWRTSQETFQVELLGYYNFTTEELLAKPKLTYDLADALRLVLGAELYTGPDGTLFGQIDEYLSGVFAEVRGSF